MSNIINGRIEYIDQLKGFAILWVVMGHISEIGLGINDTLFNHFYGSFHMPLFMFLSGIFTFKSFSKWDLDELRHFLVKKTLRIILPFVIFGGLYSIFTLHRIDYTNIDNYWFLPALFYCMVYSLFIKYLFNKLLPLKFEFLGHICLFIVLCYLYYNTTIGEIIPYFLYSIKMYPFFVLGAFYGKSEKFQNYVKNSKELLVLSIVFYLLLLFFDFKSPIILAAFFAIIILIYVFNHCRIPSRLSYLGRYSLQIYVLHWFFIPFIVPVGDFIKDFELSSILFENNGFLLLTLITFAIALPLIILCLSIYKLIAANNYLNKICFGGF